MERGFDNPGTYADLERFSDLKPVGMFGGGNVALAFSPFPLLTMYSAVMAFAQPFNF